MNVVEYDRTTALLVVDVQNDFADPKGSLSVAGGDEVVAVANSEIERARAAGAYVVYTQDWHPPSTPHFEKDGGIWPVHCVQGTWGAEFHPDLAVDGDVVQKGTGGEDGYSGFTVRDPESGDEHRTKLERLLRQHDVERIVIVGLATDYCVKDSALDAIELGFHPSVLREGIRAVNLEPDDGNRALEAITGAGGVVV
ncbi:MAG TPA: isochorismatase family protein [Actinomycetota bacterium]|nr:isochorismatase family protein [Actinomycetota bacterium]